MKRFTWSTESAIEVGPSIEMPLSSYSTISLLSFQCPAMRDRFLRDAFHQVAVGGEHIGVMVDDLLAELGGQHLLRQRHADRGGDALAERAGGGLDALGVEVLGMTRASAIRAGGNA